jgi:hypothetical protein
MVRAGGFTVRAGKGQNRVDKQNRAKKKQGHGLMIRELYA